ncbi:MAG TPA: hypothetical protein VFI39_05160 [Gemmatimonadales bacterium]|nr:hypothetical protein [Gemmatimonadales bacterium]
MRFRVRPQARLAIDVGTDLIRAEARRGGTIVWAAEAPYQGVGELADRLAELVSLEGMPRMEPSVQVRLLRPLAQVRVLDDLPRVGEAGLAGMLAHQPQRFFRKNGKPLVTDGVWLGSALRRNAPRHAAVAAVEVPVVEAVVAGARAAGFRIADIRPEQATDARLSLLPGVERGERRRARIRRLCWIGGVAAALWVALGLALVVRQRRAIARVDAELAALDGPVQALLAARARTDEARRMVAVVDSADRDGARLDRLLLGLVRTLPDSAFFSAVALRADGSGQASGAAAHPAALLVAVERSGLVTHPHLEGQGVREPIGGQMMERFTLVFGERAP